MFEKDETEFRYTTKERYEDEMKKMICKMHDPEVSGSIDADSLSDEYDDLVEEYLEFCSR